MKKLIAITAVLAMLMGVGASAHAACTQALATSAKGNWLGGLIQGDDSFKIAFYTNSATYGAATEQYSATNEVTGTNYTAGGFVLGSITFGTSGSTYWVDWPDEVNNNISFDNPADCALIYSDTAANTSCTASDAPWPCCTGAGTGTCQDAILGVWTFTAVQPSNGTLTVTFPTADASNAIVSIAQAITHWLFPDAIAAALPRDAEVALTGFDMKGFFAE